MSTNFSLASIKKLVAKAPVTAGAQTNALVASMPVVPVAPLTIQFSEDAYQGDAQYTISIDGKQYGGVGTVTASKMAGNLQTLVIPGLNASIAHTVKVTFINDAWGGNALLDRNLYVQSIDVGAFHANGAALYRSGSVSFAIPAPSAAPVVTPSPATANSIVLNVSEDWMLGDAQYTVAVDGKQVGGINTATARHGAGTNTLNLGDYADGNHTVVVTYLNDSNATLNRPDLNRSLYVDKLSYGTNTVSGTLTADGSMSFQLPATAAAATTSPLMLSMSEDAYQGNALYTISIDGVISGGIRFATASHANNQSTAVGVAGAASTGVHTVTVTFLNDAYGGPGLDRNLYVNSLSYNGVAYAGAPIYSDGSVSFTVGTPVAAPAPPPVSPPLPAPVPTPMPAPVPAPVPAPAPAPAPAPVVQAPAPIVTPPPPAPPVPVAAPSNPVTLWVSETAGSSTDAQFTVTVDGTAVGGTYTATASHAAGAETIIVLPQTLAAGPHTVDVLFAGGAGGTGTAPSLYVDGVSYAGARTTLSTGAVGTDERLTVSGTTIASVVNFGTTVSNAPAASAPATSAPAVAVIGAPTVLQATAADQVVGFNLQNAGPAPMAARIVTFGEQFTDGQVPAGRMLVATINGVQYTVQLDVKTSYADGSVQTAIVTLQQPAIAAGQTLSGILSLAPAGAAVAAPVDLSALQAGGFAMTVDLAMHNADGSTSPFHLDIAQALRTALANGTASYWLQGSQATQARIDVPVSGSLHLTVDVTGYADGTASADVQFNNDYAMQAAGGDVTYDATIKQNGQVAYQQSGIQQFQYTSWDQTIFTKGSAIIGAPTVNVQHDVAAMERTGVIQNYDTTTGVASSLIAGETASMTAANGFTPLGSAGITQYMPSTGERNDIGPLTQGDTAWVLTQNADAATYALAQAQGSGSIPWHYYDPQAGTYVTLDKYPLLWDDGRAAPYLLPLTQASDDNAWALDVSHTPQVSYAAYLETGSRYQLDQVNAEASAVEALIWPVYRQNGLGLVTNPGQERAVGWSLRTLGNAALINPDGTFYKSYLKQLVANNVASIQALAASSATTQGALSGYVGAQPGQNLISPWQQDFIAMALGQEAQRGTAGAAGLVQWEGNYIDGRYDSAAAGFDPTLANAYRMVILDSAGNVVKTWAKAAQLTVASGNTQTFNTYMQSGRAAVAETITSSNSGSAWQAYGYISAYQSGTNQASQADLQNDPKYNIVPRLQDGQLLTGAKVHITTDTLASTVNFGNGDELIYAVQGDKTVVGGAGIDILFAGTGNVTLTSGANNDFLFGGSGTTSLYAGGGTNWLQAGTGAAVFQLSAADAAQDTIAGFKLGIDHLSVTGANGAHLAGAGASGLIAGATADASGNALLHLSAQHAVTLAGITIGQLNTGLFAA